MTERGVRVSAPVRVGDAGGWTDTWFAGSGLVCNIAVGPGVEVAATARPSEAGRAESTVELDVGPIGATEHYVYALARPPGHHPLVEAAIGRWAPAGRDLAVRIHSAVPPGSGTGTSASVVVAIIAAMWALSGDEVDRARVAAAAHELEAVQLGLQSGVQDQLAAAFGGASLITVDRYPRARAAPIELAPQTWEQLQHRLVTVYLGVPHQSTLVHDEVIARLQATTDPGKLMEPLRRAARQAAAALTRGDLDAYGAALVANTEAQAALHPGLVGKRARSLIDLAARHGASGWKVNGAGGEGGTVTIVGPEDPLQLLGAVEATPGLRVLDLLPDRRGLRLRRPA